ncbi:ABC transporter permease [Halocalculus aciditolerans]|uniref:Peptide ABC transporter permease n=1 Tax=Halocalculus aciditolerans TaxID=1383812 RepID=A0A830FEH4_9EURY|nr:ABC transporter permease [Halocalculus aciditolerans]GGL47234.1 peptide ABC transporter permease [Halocalculus aciditolerans]
MSDTQTNETKPLRQRIAENPRPAAIWAAIGAVLIGVELGALLQAVVAVLDAFLNLIPGVTPEMVASIDSAFAAIPTLLSRDVIPNQGYWNGQQYVGTFFHLSPATAWAIRVVLVYAYAAVFLYWCWDGYKRYRAHYRDVDWTPRDDVVDRFSRHSWGKFGMVVVVFFLVMAVFAPTLGTTTAEENIMRPYSHSFNYWDNSTQSVQNITQGAANIHTGSSGAGDENVGPLTYDRYGRYHPFGTVTNGKDLFTEVVLGARVSLAIGIVSIVVSGLIALALGMLTAYYKGVLDLVTVVTSDSVQSIPTIMLLILVTTVFSRTAIAKVYDGALLIILIFSLVYWPYLWRSLRGPAFQVSEEEWIDAAKSYGQSPFQIMKKHMAPYVISYVLIYASLSLGGIIIGVAGLSFLGLGISAPTPEWGRIIADGQNYVATQSWHISLIPGICITLVVTGFNAFGDGIRDAIDPQSDGGADEAAAAGGGGA